MIAATAEVTHHQPDVRRCGGRALLHAGLAAQRRSGDGCRGPRRRGRSRPDDPVVPGDARRRAGRARTRSPVDLPDVLRLHEPRPRAGLVSGCYPLDDFYKERPERVELARVKAEIRKAGRAPLTTGLGGAPTIGRDGSALHGSGGGVSRRTPGMARHRAPRCSPAAGRPHGSRCEAPLRHRLAAHALRRRLRRDPLAGRVRRPRFDPDRAPDLPRGDGTGRRSLRRSQTSSVSSTQARP